MSIYEEDYFNPLAATPIAVQSAYVARGYYAVGGEWLILPLSLAIATLIEGLKHK